MDDEEILKVLKFLDLEMTILQFNKIVKYVQVDFLHLEDNNFYVHISSRNSNRIKCQIRIVDICI